MPAGQDDNGGDDRKGEHPDHTINEDAEKRPRLFVRRLAHDEENFNDIAAGRAEEEKVEEHSRENNPQGAPIGNRDVLYPQQDDPAPGLEQQGDSERDDPRQKPPEPAFGFRLPDGFEHLSVLLRIPENPPEQAAGDQNLDGRQKIFFHSKNRCVQRSLPGECCPEPNLLRRHHCLFRRERASQISGPARDFSSDSEGGAPRSFFAFPPAP